MLKERDARTGRGRNEKDSGLKMVAEDSEQRRYVSA